MLRIKEGDLCGAELDEGIHVVDFRYVPYGLKTGIFISVISLLIALGCKVYCGKNV